MGIVWLIFIFLGELLAIWSEILYAKWKNIYFMVLVMTIAWVLLLVWYWLGYKYLKNMWLIYIVSITSILILEPIIIYFLTWEVPNLWSKIWFAFWVIWFLSTIFIK